MIIRQTYSKDVIKGVLTHPEIWETISGECEDPENFEPPMSDCRYIVGYDNNDIIGLFVVHSMTGEHRCHVQVLPDHRREHSLEFGNRVIEWVWSNTDVEKMTAVIPVIYPNVRKFAHIQGFRDDGINIEGYKKSGELHNEWRLSIERGQ